MRATKAATPTTCAVIYLRVSTKKQDQSGLGREAQERACVACVEREGLRVVATKVDSGLSGRLETERLPGLCEALTLVRSTPGAALVVYSLSRYDRAGKRVWDLLQESSEGLRILSATQAIDTQTAAGRMVIRIGSAYDIYEAELASERTRAALAEARARGTRLGRPPMGVTHPELVARVRELHEEGYGAAEIAALLNAEGVVSPGGGRWHDMTVRRALRQEGKAA
jgi:DNA invertase Pin-like site-specific DNA recombinase